jgi:hypothetical protein
MLGMKRVARLNSSTAGRWKRLGDAGEKLARELLLQNGFTDVENLNDRKMNFPFADFFAVRAGVRFVISVKIRNKYEASRGGQKRLNTRYKLGSQCYEHAEAAEREFNAQSAWLTIAFDAETYDAYFGLLSSLNGNLGVRMTPKAKVKYECLAEGASHRLNYEDLKNAYEY